MPIDLPGLGLKVRDFPRLRTIFALTGAEAATLYDQAGMHVRSQRARLTTGHHEVEASTYHGIPYYFEMQGQGEESTWTILIDFGKIPGKILRDYAESQLGDMRYDLRYGDSQWLVMSTDDTPGMLDETDIEARVHEVIRALEPVMENRQHVTVARA
jgi:hypothetical protein